MPINNAVKKAKIYACKNATNNSNILKAVPPKTLAGITPYQKIEAGEIRDKCNNHCQHQMSGKHVGQKTHGQDRVFYEQSENLDKKNHRHQEDF